MGNKAIVIGDVNVDIITPPFNPEVLVQGETSVVLDEFTMSLGGNAINAAAALAALNAPHHFLGGLGDCAISSWIEKKCKELAVNTSFGLFPNQGAGITFALTYTGGRRQFVATLGTNKLIDLDHLDLKVLESVQSGDHVHRAGFWYTPKLKGTPTIGIFKDALGKGAQTSLDVGWDPENFSEANRQLLYDTLNYTEFFFGNEKEFKEITQKENIEEVYAELLGISTVIDDPKLIVHRGEKGCAIISRNGQEFIDPVPISEVINPTGSGDVFNAGFIYGLLQKWDLKKIGTFAGNLAAIHLIDLTKIYPTLQEIEKFSKKV